MGQPTALTLASAALGWLVVAVLPGWLLSTATAPRRSRLDRLAVAPVLSMGIAYPVAAWVSLFSPSGLQAAFVALVVVSCASGGALLRRKPWAPLPSRLHVGRDGLGILLACSLALALWVAAMATSRAGWSLVAPDTDGSQHGLYVTHILLTGAVNDPRGYPLGMHVIAALVGWATSVPSALVVPLTLLASAWGVLGAAAFARRMAPTAAPWAALSAACLVPLFPFGQVAWGPVPLSLALALLPATALAVLDATSLRSTVLAVLAFAGLLSLHVTEALVVGLLVLITAATTRSFGARFRFGAAVVVGALVLCAPLVAGLIPGGISRPPDPSPTDSIWLSIFVGLVKPFTGTPTTGPMWGFALAASSVFLMLTVVGGARAWRLPLGRPLVLLVLLMLLLSVLCRVRQGGILTVPWYGDTDRLVAQVAALVPMLLGLGLQRAASSTRERAVFALVAGSAGLIMAAQSLALAVTGLGEHSVVTTSDRAAFAWLAQHVAPGEHVLNDTKDGSVWMVEATRGVAQPLFTGEHGATPADDPEAGDRTYLRDHVALIASDPEAQRAARKWRVRFVLIGERTLVDEPRQIDAPALAAADGMRQVFSAGGARVYEIVAP